MYIRSPVELAIALRDQRKRIKMSQARAADLVGLKQATLSGVENHPEGIRLDTLFRILSALNLELHIEVRGTQQNKSEW